jgi:phosphate transport system permease protein
VIANEFGEATGLHRSALFAAGVVLFVLTLLVNAAARVLVMRSARSQRPGRGARRGRQTDMRAVAEAAAGA